MKTVTFRVSPAGKLSILKNSTVGTMFTQMLLISKSTTFVHNAPIVIDISMDDLMSMVKIYEEKLGMKKSRSCVKDRNKSKSGKSGNLRNS